MPGSLQSPPRMRVTRNESTRSDHSDGSNTSQSSAAGKKVSFSKAVRVKKYARPKKNSLLTNGDAKANGGIANGVPPGSGSPEKRFWFKVYKNKHRQPPDPKELRTNDVIYYDNDIGNNVIRHVDDDIISYHPNPSPLNYPVLTAECGTQTPPKESSTRLFGSEPTPLHPSQMPPEPPHVQRNHVKKIVNRFNEEAVLTRQRSSDGDMSPPGSPVGSPRHQSTPVRVQRIPTPPPEPPTYYSSSNKQRSEPVSKFKKNPIVNGVKVIFGMGQLKKKDKAESPDSRHHHHHVEHRSQETDTSDLLMQNGKVRDTDRHPYKTEIIVSDNSETETKRSYDRSYKEQNKTNNQDIVSRSRGGLFRHDEYGNYEDYANDEDEFTQRRGKVHVETFDSGNKLVFDTTDVNTASTKTDRGELFCTVGEKHQLWQNNKRIVVYEEPSPRIIRRKAKSHSDLSNARDDHVPKGKVDKGVSTEHLLSTRDETPKKSKDTWLRLWRHNTKDKGVQCSKVPTSEDALRDEIYTSGGKYKIVRPRNGIVSAYSNVPNLEKHSSKERISSTHTDEYTSGISSSYQNGDIYSQVDKTKKRRDAEKKKKYFGDEEKSGSLFKSRSEPLYIGPSPRDRRNLYEDHEGSYFEEDGDRTIKTSKRSFGFRLSPGREDSFRKGNKNGYHEENWYDVDEDVRAVEKLRSRGAEHRDISEIREELADEEFASDFSSSGEQRRNDVGVGSVMREVDYKKQEISYENVPRSEGESNLHTSTSMGSGLWYRDADEDYRREMAQNEVSYPAGNHVGSDRFYTVSRTDKASKQKPPPSPRAYTLDRRHFKEKKKSSSNPSGVKILVNGKEVNENGKSSKKSRGYYRKSRVSEDPSSVQSDPLYVRGGLAAAYQARQRAAVRRSNSSVAGIGGGYHASPVISRRYRGASEASGASSETESAHARKPLIMYIPGVSHYEKSPEEGDRSSAVNVARSQSMMTSSRPSRTSKSSKSHHRSKQDIYRNADFYEEDEIMPLASETNRKKPPKVPYDSKKNSDIKRRHSMPKDTKFSWLKWKIRGKPSREP